jgi:hypothetical protein
MLCSNERVNCREHYRARADFNSDFIFEARERVMARVLPFEVWEEELFSNSRGIIVNI